VPTIGVSSPSPIAIPEQEEYARPATDTMWHIDYAQPSPHVQGAYHQETDLEADLQIELVAFENQCGQQAVRLSELPLIS